MKKLLIKEIKLSLDAHIIIFVILSLTILVPDYPPVASIIISLSGLMTLFPRNLANKDIEYTSLLPIKKTDVVKAKMLFIGLVELSALLLAIVGGLIRGFLYHPSQTPTSNIINAFKPCISYIGFALLTYGVTNCILFSLYYKNPFKKITGPNLISLFSALILLIIITIIMVFAPILSSYDMYGLIAQFGILLFGGISFYVLSYVGYRIGAKEFNKIDL